MSSKTPSSKTPSSQASSQAQPPATQPPATQPPATQPQATQPQAALSPEQSWHITQRWQQYEGEARANLLRIVAVGTFYLIHLWNYFSSQGKLPDWQFLQLAKAGEIDRRFHVLATLLALAWIMMAAAVHLSLRAKIFPDWLPLASSLGDVLFLTSILVISSGPQSPLIVGYFLVIALSALRFDLRLVQVTSFAVVVGYLCVLGYVKWPATFGGDAAIDYTVPRYEQLVVVLGLALTGVITGQVVRRVRGFADDFAARAARNNTELS